MSQIPFIEACVFRYKSCTISTEFLTKEKSIDIHHVVSIIEGKGHCRKCMEIIEKIGRKNKLERICVLDVVNPRLERLLTHMGYTRSVKKFSYQQFEVNFEKSITENKKSGQE